MISILGLDHLVLRVKDLEGMTRFYSDALGCTLERSLEEVRLNQLRAGRSLIDLVDIAGPIGQAGGAGPGDEGRNLDHFCVRIEPFDAEAIRAHLATFGVKPGSVERRYGADGYGPSIYFQDPEGNTVELKGPPDERQ